MRIKNGGSADIRAAQQAVAADGRPPSLGSVWRPQLNAGTLGTHD
jgi:hypothetical protein